MLYHALLTIPAFVAAFGLHAGDIVSPDADVSGVLDAYIAREQPAFDWSLVDVVEMSGDVQQYRLRLTSQTWRGIEWTHALNVLVPPAERAAGERARPGHAILVITSGDQETHATVCGLLAWRLGVPIAVLHYVPNQPLLPEKSAHGRGLREDDLIAQTFLEFAESGDVDWPLLLPMTRSVISAMDALEQFSTQMTDEQPGTWSFGVLEQFLTTGASKRGWTTWLSAAADDRVFAIAPMVYDNLNLPQQVPLHFATWGEPSPSIADYTERGLLELLATPRGRQLMQIVDPFAYRDRIDVPKLLLFGTNDSYWPLDAVNLYIGEIIGPTWCHYAPNQGHGMGASIEALLAIGGFFDAVTGRTPPLPTVALRPGADGGASITVTPATIEGAKPVSSPLAVRLLFAEGERRDFRQSRWMHLNTSLDEDGAYRTSVNAIDSPPDGDQLALIAEVELADSLGNRFLIHTHVTIVGGVAK